MDDYGSNLALPAPEDGDEEELRRWREELFELMLQAELYPKLSDFWGKRRSSTLRPL